MSEVTPFETSLEVGPDAATVRVTGEIDPATTDQLDGAIASAIDSGAASVVVDLSGVTFIDSSGLRVLVSNHHRLVDAERTLVLTGLQPSVRRVFELAGLDQALGLDG